MPPRKRRTRKKAAKPVLRASSDENPHLPGYLLIAFGLMGTFINFDLLSGMEWTKAYPLLLVLFGFVVLVKVTIARD